MKHLSKIVCLFLVISLTLTIPVSAVSASPWASNYFGSYSCYLWDVSSTGFQVWFDVRAVRTMSELGASTIKVQRSTDTVNWGTVQTYTKEDNPEMTIKTGTTAHASHIVFDDADSGFYYRASVELYAENSSGTATKTIYTSYVYIP